MLEIKEAAPQSAEEKHTIPEVVEVVKKEIKGFGDDLTKHKAGVEKSLADLRKEHEEAKKAGLDGKAEVELKLDKYKTEVLEKIGGYEDTAKKIHDRMDQVESLVTRGPVAADGLPEDQKQLRKEAMEFKAAQLVAQGRKFYHEDLPTLMNLDEFKAYDKAFIKFIRGGKSELSDADRKALATGKDPSGGYLVKPYMSSRIVTIRNETSPMRQLAAVEQTSSGEWICSADLVTATFSWAAETSPRAKNTLTDLDDIHIHAHEAVCRLPVTQIQLEDSIINVEQWITNKGGESMALGEATSFVLGDGNKKPRGFLTYAAGTSWGQIEQTNSGATTGATYPGIVAILTLLKEFYHARAVWLMRRTTLGAMLLIQDGNSQYIFAPRLSGTGAGTAFPATLMGYPVRMAADMPAAASNALGLAFGDFSRGYQIVDRIGFSVLRDPYTDEPNVLFKMRLRVGGDVANFEAIKIGKCATIS